MLSPDTKELNLLLAAGEARRMGMPKQLLVHQDQPLIRRVCKMLLHTDRPVLVVLGARSSMIKPIIDDLPVDILSHGDWTLGMGSSLKAGLAHAQDICPQLQKILITVVDQIKLEHKVLKQFWTQAERNELLAARYANGKVGVPALFARKHFPQLMKLDNHQGARVFLAQQLQSVFLIDFSEGDKDVDTPSDWEKLRF